MENTVEAKPLDQNFSSSPTMENAIHDCKPCDAQDLNSLPRADETSPQNLEITSPSIMDGLDDQDLTSPPGADDQNSSQNPQITSPSVNDYLHQDLNRLPIRTDKKPSQNPQILTSLSSMDSDDQGLNNPPLTNENSSQDPQITLPTMKDSLEQGLNSPPMADQSSSRNSQITSTSVRDFKGKDPLGQEPSCESGQGGLFQEGSTVDADQSPVRKRVRKAGEGSRAANLEEDREVGGSEGEEMVVEGQVMMYPCPWKGCNKDFATERALFGHLKIHPQRTWRGAFPPPVFSREEFEYTGLLNPLMGEEEEEGEGGEVLLPPDQASKEAVAAGGGTVEAPAARLDIDLNVELFLVPDLNRTPPRYGGCYD